MFESGRSKSPCIRSFSLDKSPNALRGHGEYDCMERLRVFFLEAFFCSLLAFFHRPGGPMILSLGKLL